MIVWQQNLDEDIVVSISFDICIAEKENVQIVTPEMNSGLPSKEKMEKIRAAQDLYKSLLRIPRRSV